MKKRWRKLWRRIARSDAEAEFAALEAAYSEPHRAYHNLRHIAHCLAWLDRAFGEASDAQSLETTIWFHDVVYDPHAFDNEAKSAEWARRALREGDAEAALIDKVVHLILATSHELAPDGADACLLVDIDLSILGAGPARYAEYKRAIRREYASVPRELFLARRADLLGAFLERPFIYFTSWFRDRLEGRARANLAEEIAELNAGGSGIDW